MSKQQTDLLDQIRKLPLDERRELFRRARADGLIDDAFYDHMTPDQRAVLLEGIAQADRGEVVDGNAAFDRFAKRFDFRRP